MKPLDAIAFALLLALGACRVVIPLPRPDTVTNATSISNVIYHPLLDNNPALGADSPPPAKRPKVTPVSPVTPLLPGDPSSPSVPTPPAVSPQAEWQKYVCRGQKLTLASKADKDKAEEFVLPINTQWDGTLENELKLWGYTEDPYPDCDFDGEYYDISRAYEALHVLPDDENEDESDPNECFRIHHYDPNKVDEDGHDIWAGDQTYKVNDKEYRITGAHGTFGVNVAEGIVWFIDVASASLKAASLWGVPNPPVEQLPALRQMSDISWGFWTRAHGGSDLGRINKFIVPQIINEITLRLIDEALKTYIVPQGQERLTAVPTWPGITFDIETDQGQALLGSPNGIAAAYFLSQHKSQIGGNRYVHQITVFQPDSDDDNEPTIIYNVKDAPKPSSEDEKNEDKPEGQEERGVRRDLAVNTSRLSLALPVPVARALSGNLLSLAVATEPTPPTSEQTFWQKYVCRGEKLTQASKRNIDKAIQFADPVDSEWDGTLEAELKLWGYAGLKGKSLYCDLSNIAEDLNKVGVDAKFKSRGGQNECFSVKHSRTNDRNDKGEKIPPKDQRYTVGDKTYRMTDAYSVIGVNARDGVISFLDVRSAEKGASMTWGVEKPPIDELPKLRQISDLAWGFWNRVHPGKENLNQINKFLVHDIINQDTLDLIKRALATYKVPDGQQRYTRLPKWPGLVFDIGTEEGQAMLGSPNGVAAGYFLSQHKRQLGGNKYVHQVTVWNDRDGDEQMMFWVKDAPEEDDRNEMRVRQHRGVNAEGKMVKRSIDGKNIVREHLVRAQL